MATFDAFLGPSYKARSLAISAQRSLNLYLEADESHAEAKTPRALIGAPGLSLFGTLPTMPVRGIWTGLIEHLPGSTGSDACLAVGGSKLYSVASNGATTLIGDVGDDASHSPVTFQVNGSQVLITSAGLAWIYDNVTLERCYFNNGIGTVDTSGTAVTYVSGDPFDSTLVGAGIVINSVTYLIAAYVDETHITLAASAGVQTGVAYRILAGAGTVNLSDSYVTWVSGDKFTGLTTGDKVVINGAIRTVGTVYGQDLMLLSDVLTGDVFGVNFSHSRPVEAAMSAYLNTFFIVVPPNSKTFYISAANDGKSWSPLDFERKQAFPDNIAGMIADHQELWLLGTEFTEVWSPASGDFPFALNQAASIAQGIRAAFTVQALANGVAWLGGDVRGGPVAWRADGFTPVRISTHAIEAVWGGYSTCTDATAFVYVEDGHQFWVLNFPTANATWVYDATAGTWHERSWWNGTSDDRIRQHCHGVAYGRHLVGDRSNGKIYEQSLDFTDDAGTAKHYLRTAPHLSNEELWTYYSRFRVSMQAGPAPTLAWSGDLGVTFNAARSGSARRIGSTTQATEWRRLGRDRDRVFRMEILESTYRVAITGCYLDAKTGNG